MSTEASKPPTPPAAFRSALLFPEDANLKAYATPDSPSENPLNQRTVDDATAEPEVPPDERAARASHGVDLLGYDSVQITGHKEYLGGKSYYEIGEFTSKEVNQVLSPWFSFAAEAAHGQIYSREIYGQNNKNKGSGGTLL